MHLKGSDSPGRMLCGRQAQHKEIGLAIFQSEVSPELFPIQPHIQDDQRFQSRDHRGMKPNRDSFLGTRAESLNRSIKFWRSKIGRRYGWHLFQIFGGVGREKSLKSKDFLRQILEIFEH